VICEKQLTSRPFVHSVAAARSFGPSPAGMLTRRGTSVSEEQADIRGELAFILYLSSSFRQSRAAMRTAARADILNQIPEEFLPVNFYL